MCCFSATVRAREESWKKNIACKTQSKILICFLPLIKKKTAANNEASFFLFAIWTHAPSLFSFFFFFLGKIRSFSWSSFLNLNGWRRPKHNRRSTAQYKNPADMFTDAYRNQNKMLGFLRHRRRNNLGLHVYFLILDQCQPPVYSGGCIPDPPVMKIHYIHLTQI